MFSFGTSWKLHKFIPVICFNFTACPELFDIVEAWFTFMVFTNIVYIFFFCIIFITSFVSASKFTSKFTFPNKWNLLKFSLFFFNLIYFCFFYFLEIHNRIQLNFWFICKTVDTILSILNSV